jgi:prepilin-type N-terminal cleavage/methylation domain-containing protein
LSSVPSTRGFTLVEALMVVALVGIVALAAIPVLRSQDPARLDAAAVEVGNVLRFAISEANRSGGYLLVDASNPAHLRVLNSNAAGAMLAPVRDPLTRHALELDAAARPWSGQVSLSPRFYQGGTPYSQLLISPGPQMQVVDAGVNRGPLQAGSGVVVTLGSLNTLVTIAETTGRVGIP